MDFFSLRNIISAFSPFYVNGYPFLIMVWNILLAMVPFIFFLALSSYWQKTKFKKTGQKILAIVLFLFWLIFLPNAAYLIADTRHLLNYCPSNSYLSVCVSGVWEIMFFFVYSVFGWVFLVIYLSQMRKFLAEIFKERTARTAIMIIIPLVALGVLLGLTERFNSWDFFIHPLPILQNLLRYVTAWEYFRNWLAFTTGYYILYFFGDYLFAKKIAQ
jgi:uncharacterized membrane protein